MSEEYHFDYARRVREVAYPLGIVFVLVALLVLFRPPTSSWKLWTGLGVACLLSLGTVKFVLDGKHPLKLEADKVSRGGVSVPFEAAQLELKVLPGAKGPRVSEVIVWMPLTRAPGKVDVRFDPSLVEFERAVTELFARVPEARIVVSAFGSADVRDERREAVLSRYRPPPPPEPTAAEKALALLGKMPLVPPSKMH